jgi:hypothetical protein
LPGKEGSHRLRLSPSELIVSLLRLSETGLAHRSIIINLLTGHAGCKHNRAALFSSIMPAIVFFMVNQSYFRLSKERNSYIYSLAGKI